MKNILLTGANGLLGQKIVQIFAERQAPLLEEYQLIASGKGENRNPDLTGYRYESADLTDAARVAELFATYQFSAVMHTAAQTLVDDAEDNREHCDLLNVTVVEQLAGLCATYGAQLIHISTDFIFDGTAGPYAEEAAPNPLGYYGLSKLRAEQAIAQSGCRYAILRTMLLYGITPAMSRSNIVLWVKSSLEAGKTIRVVNDQFRCPTLAEDLAMATILTLAHGATGVYHVSGDEGMTMLELAHRVAQFFGLDESLIEPIDSASLQQRAKRPPITGFIIDKARRELGYAPHAFAEGLALLKTQLRIFA